MDKRMDGFRVIRSLVMIVNMNLNHGRGRFILIYSLMYCTYINLQEIVTFYI